MDSESAAKRARVLAPKGSALNNPFRGLPLEALAIIKPMAKSWSPTPSAMVIKQADLDIYYSSWDDHMIVYVRAVLRFNLPGAASLHFLLPHEVDERVAVHYPLGRVIRRRELKFRRYIQRLRKGGILNNPFRELPNDVLATIRHMARRGPTPSALAIKQAEIEIAYHPSGDMMRVYVGEAARFIPYAFTRNQSVLIFLLPHIVDDMIVEHSPLGRVVRRAD